MSKKLLITIIVLVVLVWGGYIAKQKIGPINIPDKAEQPIKADFIAGEIVPGIRVPEGFELTYFAKNVPDARVIEFAPYGRMLVSQTKQGKISWFVDGENDGVAENRGVLVEGLKNPHGMVMICNPVANPECLLYVAESNALTRFAYDAEAGTVGDKTKLADIPYSVTDNHFTRSLLQLPAPNQDTLLISVGSSCNVCDESDAAHGTILSYNIKTQKLEQYAEGTRNAPFMTLDPVHGKVFATEMGRDGLGDNTPPDEINIIEKGKNYGWPICYGQNIHDTNFDKKTYIRNPCMVPFETPAAVDLQAHSAPLGLSFIPEEGWNEDYWYDLLVAYHGSWNRSVPTGYKIVRIPIDSEGRLGKPVDFITGWLTADGKKLGRPVDIKVMPGGVAYITDDSAGMVYKLSATTMPR